MKVSKSKKATSPKQDNKSPKVADLSHIHLEGEKEESVKILDTRDDVRKKINDHLKGPLTQAALCRELSELMPYDTVNARHLQRFLKFKGPRAGGHSPVFYAGYVYFEKLQLHQGKKKSAKREKMEEAWNKEGGVLREGSHNIQLFCVAGESWRIVYLGQIQIKGQPSGFSGAIKKKKASR